MVKFMKADKDGNVSWKVLLFSNLIVYMIASTMNQSAGVMLPTQEDISQTVSTSSPKTTEPVVVESPPPESERQLATPVVVESPPPESERQLATPVAPASTTTTAFDSLSKEWYDLSKRNPNSEVSTVPRTPKPFNLDTWEEKTSGGLHDNDRIKVAEIYGKANSLFEWGLGESSVIAAFQEIPRYAGIDSDPAYVAGARDKAPFWFRFYFADIAKAGAWGRTSATGKKKIFYNYIWGPLLSELEPFDVYMVDGRMRPLCACAAFLHAAKYNKMDSLVMIHDMYDANRTDTEECPDCHRDRGKGRVDYHRIKEIADVIDYSRAEVLVFKRKSTTTDQDIVTLYNSLMKSSRKTM